MKVKNAAEKHSLVSNFQFSIFNLIGVPNGIRTRVAAVKGRCPRPLDERDIRLGEKQRGTLQDDSWPVNRPQGLARTNQLQLRQSVKSGC